MAKMPTATELTFVKDKEIKNGARYTFNPEGERPAPITGSIYVRFEDPSKAPNTITVRVSL